MAKFGSRTVLLIARPVSPILNIDVDPAKGAAHERTRFLSDIPNETSKKDLGSIKRSSKEGIVVEKKTANVESGKKGFVTDVISEGTFNLFVDYQSSGTTSNIELPLAEHISVSELKALELGWGGNGSFISGASIASSRMNIAHSQISSTEQYGEQVSLNSLIVSANKSSSISVGNFFGNLEQGNPDNETTCAEQEQENTDIKTNFLLKQVNGVYINKVSGMSNADWITFVADIVTSECAG